MSKILVVEDNPYVADYTRELLEDEGYECQVTADPVEAFRRVREDRPDLIILDSWLEGYEIQGPDIAQSLKTDPATASIPIIGMSGMEEEGRGDNTLHGVCDCFIPKPFDPLEMLEAISRFLGRNQDAAL